LPLPGWPGKTDSVMNTDDPKPILLAARSAVLLIFFMPPEAINRHQRAALTALADAIQTGLGSLVRVLRVDEATHPDVVQSFAITQTPAFVLLRRGVELWRQQGLSDEATLIGLIRALLTVEPVEDQLPT
jgi:thioredoxin-like negative regulator of GroEL